MDVDVWDAELLRGLEKRKEVADVRMNAPVGDLKIVFSALRCNDPVVPSYQSEEVQSTVAVLCTLEALQDRGVLVEFPLLDGHIDPDNILPDNAPSANVQMSAGEIHVRRKP